MATDRADFEVAIKSNLARTATRDAKAIDKLVASLDKLKAHKDPFAAAAAGAATTRVRDTVPTAAPKARRAGGVSGGGVTSRAPNTSGVDREFERMARERERQERAAAKEAERSAAKAAAQSKKLAAQQFAADKKAASEALKGFNIKAKLQKKQAKDQAAAAKAEQKAQDKARREQEKAAKQAQRLAAGGGGNGVNSGAARDFLGELPGGGRLAGILGGSGAAAAGAAAAGVLALGSAFAFAAAKAGLFEIKAKRALGGFLGSAEAGAAEFEETAAMAERFGSDLQDTIAQRRELAGAGFDDKTSDDLLKMAASLDAMQGDGKGAQALGILSEISDFGEVTTRNIKALNKAGIDATDIYAELGRQFNTDRDGVDKLIKEGKISTDVFTKAAVAASMASNKESTLGGAAERVAQEDPDKRLASTGVHIERMMGRVGQALMPTINAGLDAILPRVEALADEFGNLFTDLVNDPASQEIFSIIVDSIGGAIDFVREAFPTLKAMAIETLHTYGDLFATLRDNWPTIKKAAEPFFGFLMFGMGVARELGGVMVRAASVAIDAWAAVADPVMNVFGAIVDFVGGIFDWVKARFGEFKSFLSSIWDSIPAPIRAALESTAAGKAVGAVGKILGLEGTDRFAKDMQTGKAAADGALKSVRETGSALDAFASKRAANDNALPFAHGNVSNDAWLQAARESLGETIAQDQMLMAAGAEDMAGPVVRPAGSDPGKIGAGPKTTNVSMPTNITVNITVPELADGSTIAQVVQREVESTLDKFNNTD